MLNAKEKSLVYMHVYFFVSQLPTGVDTRDVAKKVVTLVKPQIPNITVYHVYGIFSALLRSNNYILSPRKAGSSKIVKI